MTLEPQPVGTHEVAWRPEIYMKLFSDNWLQQPEREQNAAAATTAARMAGHGLVVPKIWSLVQALLAR